MPAHNQPVAWVDDDGTYREGNIIAAANTQYLVRRRDMSVTTVYKDDAYLLHRIKTSFAVLAETQRQLKALSVLYGSQSFAISIAVEQLYQAKKHLLLE